MTKEKQKKAKKQAATDKSRPAKIDASRGNLSAALSFIGIGLVAGAAVTALGLFDKWNATGSDEMDGGLEDRTTDVGQDERQTRSVVHEPMRYTGNGTPDMAVSYTPGLNGSEDRVAGDEENAVGTPEQRDALAGVNS